MPSKSTQLLQLSHTKQSSCIVFESLFLRSTHHNHCSQISSEVKTYSRFWKAILPKSWSQRNLLPSFHGFKSPDMFFFTCFAEEMNPWLFERQRTSYLANNPPTWPGSVRIQLGIRIQGVNCWMLFFWNVLAKMEGDVYTILYMVDFRVYIGDLPNTGRWLSKACFGAPLWPKHRHCLPFPISWCVSLEIKKSTASPLRGIQPNKEIHNLLRNRKGSWSQSWTTKYT